MNIDINKLKYDNQGRKYSSGYRIVYFYDDKYTIGEYCQTIEGFMIGFCDSYPIIDNNDIPKFMSIDDLLERYLKSFNNVTKVALYKTDGTCISTKERIHKKDKQFT